ncbi:MAG: hypothetical protein M1497_05945 [Nitrospirae bacterium]|nr:hypothetical protein [Nitrospirota bacterium]
MSEAIHSLLRTAAKGTALVFAGMAASRDLWFVTKLLIVGNLSKEDLGIYAATAFLQGISVEDLPDRGLLDDNDPDYRLLISLVAQEES